MPRLHRLRTRLADRRVLAFSLIVAVVSSVWLGTRWSSGAEFLAAIDHTPHLFHDFVAFWRPAGQAIRDGQPPVEGYYYSPTFALLMVPFAALPEGLALWIWGGLQLLGIGLLFLIPAVAFLRRSQLLFCLHLSAFAVAVPWLQNLKWGQVSTAMVLCTWGCILAYQGKRRGLAAVLLALSVVIKFYSGALLVWFLLRRDFRFVLACLVLVAVLGFGVPTLILGPEATVDCYRMLSSRLAELRPRLLEDHNSQYLAHVGTRGLHGLEFLIGTTFLPVRGDVVLSILRFAGWFGGGLSLLLLGRLRGSRSSLGALEGAGVVFLSIPLFVETSWPHYFVFLPVLQALVAGRLLGAAAGGPRSVLRWALLAASVVLSSTPLHQGVGYVRHGHWGALCFASLFLLAAMHLAPRPHHCRVAPPC